VRAAEGNIGLGLDWQSRGAMQNRPTFAHGFLLAVAIFLAVPTLISAQTPNPQRRITQAIDETKLTRLSGNTHPLARPEFDRGAAPSSLPMQRMLLVLKRSPEQESALDTLLEQQQDASSPNYHKWLTPQQFGQEFGPSDQDIQTITSWLQSQGFQIDDVSNGRTVIEFSGNAGEVQAAFHTAIHKYSVSGKDHWANASDPEIPTALTPVVAGINTLHNFRKHAMHHVAGVFARSRETGAARLVEPQLTGPCPGAASITCYAVGPADFAKIYGVPNLLNPPPAPAIPQNGNGVTIAIVGRSNINLQDVQDFRSMFGLPPNDPTIIPNGPDPGQVAGDETEADLDVEWAGAVAPSATIVFVVSQSTETSDGVDLSAEYIVDNNLAPILSESFGACEAALGAAGCDFSASFPSPAQDGLQVSGIASTPYNVAVGGTDFNDLNNHAPYWNTTNDSTTLASAKGYIPETTWNDS
jgi:hypothetical protein